jgi:sensor domain CHASE-containing protein
MRTKTLILALGLAVLAVAASTTYVLAYRGSGSSYYSTTSNVAQVQNEEWWNDMRTYMQQHGQDNKDDAWWNETRTHMEQRWGNIQSDDWWNEMRQYMEEHWTELETGGYSYGSYGGYGGYGGYDRCGGCR